MIYIDDKIPVQAKKKKINLSGWIDKIFKEILSKPKEGKPAEQMAKTAESQTEVKA